MRSASLSAVVVALAFGSLAPALARADDGAESPTTVSASAPGRQLTLGARVGGYGFRATEGEQAKWNECRMNGVGLFGELALAGPWFIEAGLDAYFADDTASIGPADGGAAAWPIDRVSGLFTVAGGARLSTWRWFSPYLQLGVGVEATRVKTEGWPVVEESAVLPLAFVGVGGDIHVTRRFAVGMNIRVAAMGLFELAPAGDRFSRETELASQAQFYAKFDL